MINFGKCPHCEKTITHVNLEPITMNVTLQPKWKGNSYSCPDCSKILGVEMDPLAVADTLKNYLLKALRNPR